MLDILMLVIGVGSFALLIGYVALCERLWGCHAAGLLDRRRRRRLPARISGLRAAATRAFL